MQKLTEEIVQNAIDTNMCYEVIQLIVMIFSIFLVADNGVHLECVYTC